MSLHNPGYTGEMAGNEPHTTGVQASYAEVGETQLIAQNRVNLRLVHNNYDTIPYVALAMHLTQYFSQPRSFELCFVLAIR